jgi:hypothetical protein
VAKWAFEFHVIDPGVPSPANERLHRHAIEALAREVRVPVERVAYIYSRELQHLMASARVSEYLPVLTLRRVRILLREQFKPRQAG